MEIGTKIRHARNEAKLTQEQAAEALGVSRQTVSNWENEKSYPDIISVIKMSDLYSVSLDHLLKEESAVKQTYMEYLEESVDAVKSKNKLSKIILIATYLVIWAAAEIVFWFFTSGSDAMGYSIMFLWILLPVMTFIISLLIGKNNEWGKAKWLFAIFFGIMFMLVPYSTFSAKNMAAFYTFRWPNFWVLPVGSAISLVGLGIGTFLRHIQKKRETLKNS